MSDKKQIYYANSIDDIFYQLKSISGLEIVSGCTQRKHLSGNSLCIRNVKELNFTSKHERHIDFGPEITLSQILALDPARIPSVFFEAVKTVANSNIRNIATLAGNICAKNYKHTLFAPLVALDASLEVKNGSETGIIPMSKFSSIPAGWILTRIIIPLEDWEVAIFKRLGPTGTITKNSASFVFLADTTKGQISNLKIAFAGPFSLRSKELENMLLGANLPLSQNSIDEFLEKSAEIYDEFKGEMDVPAILKAQFINLVKYSLEQLT